jgi:hypothetical protein
VLPQNRQDAEGLRRRGLQRVAPHRGRHRPGALRYRADGEVGGGSARPRAPRRVPEHRSPARSPKTIAVVGASRQARSRGARAAAAPSRRRVHRGSVCRESACRRHPGRPHRRSARVHRGTRSISWSSRCRPRRLSTSSRSAPPPMCTGWSSSRRVLPSRGKAGQKLEKRMLRLARDSGMRVVGPTSFGLINTSDEVRMNASLAPSDGSGRPLRLCSPRADRSASRCSSRRPAARWGSRASPRPATGSTSRATT